MVSLCETRTDCENLLQAFFSKRSRFFFKDSLQPVNSAKTGWKPVPRGLVTPANLTDRPAFTMLFQRSIRAIRLGVQSLKLHKLRSLLTILGVVFGVASVIVMLAVGEGARTEAIQAIGELGATNIILRSVKPVGLGSDGESTGAIRYGLTTADLNSIAARVPSLSAVAPMREHRRTAAFQDRRVECRVVGVTPEFQQLNRIQIRKGRFIETLDVTRGATVAVLGAQAAESLFPPVDPVGKYVRLDEDRSTLR